MIDGDVVIIAVPSTRGVNRFDVDTSVRRTVVDTTENDFRYEMEDVPQDGEPVFYED